MSITEKRYPETLEGAVDRLISSMSEQDRKKLTSMSETDLMFLHFVLGNTVRNSFGLWAGNKKLLKACVQKTCIQTRLRRGFGVIDGCDVFATDDFHAISSSCNRASTNCPAYAIFQKAIRIAKTDSHFTPNPVQLSCPWFKFSCDPLLFIL